MRGGPSPLEVEAFRETLAREAGLRFGDDRLAMLVETMETRRRALGMKTVKAYLARVASVSEEIGELARTLTVSETYFFRDRGQFGALDALVRELGGGSRLRLLSAGCSSGEEAYSLAMAVAEVTEVRPSVVGVDVNPAAIAKAREGSYGRWSLRETPVHARSRYFVERHGRHVVVDSIRRGVRFERQNLCAKDAPVWRREAYDIVFCRNVLMYLTPEAARGVLARIARSLAPGGHLFVGHAESLRGLSKDFLARQSHDAFHYQRRSLLDEGAPGVGSTWVDLISQASKRIEALAGGEAKNRESAAAASAPPAVREGGDAREGMAAALELMARERYHDALEALATTRASSPPDVLLLRAMLLASVGDLAAAEFTCEELLAGAELHAGAHYVMAMCREQRGDELGAVRHSQRAADLDPGFAMPHLQLGRLARRGGDLAVARHELALALALLTREDARRILLFGGGFSRDALAQLCRGELEHCGGYR